MNKANRLPAKSCTTCGKDTDREIVQCNWCWRYVHKPELF